jgi:threonine dehydrogenase-like Zn-dependent dehydrogenase
MRALCFNGQLHYRADQPKPVPGPGQALIRVELAGICNTDIEIVRGYKGFNGILGHEFVGVVEQANETPELVGQRVISEINLYCGQCRACNCGDARHCANRTTLGINGRDGAMADYVAVPANLVHPVSPRISNEAAVFTEPLAAACQILEQVHVRPTDRVVVLGDGKLGLLVAQVLHLTGCNLVAVGRHPNKLAILEQRGIRTQPAGEKIPPDADIVVEATGSPAGFKQAQALVRPGGTLVLKSTFYGEVTLDLSQLIVNEITVVGSRCGPFNMALRLLEQRLVDVEPLIHATYSLEDGLAAFERAATPGVLKVLLTP